MNARIWITVVIFALVAGGTGCRTPKKNETVNLRLFLQTSLSMPESRRYQIVFEIDPTTRTTFWVNSAPELSERDVIAAEVVESGGVLKMKLVFTGHGKFVLESLTGANRGKKMAIVMNSRPVAAIKIENINRTGELLFTTILTDEETREYVTGLKAMIGRAKFRGDRNPEL